jgi:putative transposase
MANENTITERNTFGGKPMQEFAYRIGIMLSSYTQAINKQNNTTGSLFQQKTKVKILCDYNDSKKDSYLEDCFFYIHNNPVAAGLVKHINEWPYSSYPDYVKLRNGNLCKQEIFLQTTGLSVTDILNRTMIEILPDVVKRFY